MYLQKRKTVTFTEMRMLAALLSLFLVVCFSGVPDVISGLLDSETKVFAMNDESDSQEKEDSTEKEEKEKEDVKESVIAGNISIATLNSGRALEAQNRILLEGGYLTEDHSPPPERA